MLVLVLVMLGVMVLASVVSWMLIVSEDKKITALEEAHENRQKRRLPMSQWAKVQEVLSRQAESAAARKRIGRAANDKRP
jgi:biopolymer transport protein ExbB/TolQ